MRESRRVSVHLIERVEYGLYKPDRSIDIKPSLRGSRTNILQSQPRNVVENDEASERRGKHIDNSGKRRMPQRDKRRGFARKQGVNVWFYPGDGFDIDWLLCALITRQVEVAQWTAIKESLDEIAILQNRSRCQHDEPRLDDVPYPIFPASAFLWQECSFSETKRSDIDH